MSANGSELGRCPRYPGDCQGSFVAEPIRGGDARFDMLCGDDGCSLPAQVNQAPEAIGGGSYMLKDLPPGPRPDMSAGFADLMRLSQGSSLGVDWPAERHSPSVREWLTDGLTSRSPWEGLGLDVLPGGMLVEPFSEELLDMPVEEEVRPREFQLASLGMRGLRAHFAGALHAHAAAEKARLLENENIRPDIGPDCE